MRTVLGLAGVVVVGSLASGAVRDARAQTGWGSAPQLISAVHSNGANMLAPKVAVDGAGNAIAVWLETGTSADAVVVRSARYSRAAGTWGAAVTLSDTSAPRVDDPQVAVDAAGNAVATWTALGGAVASRARAARYSAAAGTWNDIVLPATMSGRARVAANAAGDAVIVWNVLSGPVFAPPLSLLASRFAVATGTWTVPETLAATLPAAPANGSVAIDGAGNVHVVWLGQATAQATSFTAATSTWGGVVDLSAPIANLAVEPPHVAANTAGDAVVSWSRGAAVEAARWPAGAGGWESPVTVAAGVFPDVTRTAVDAGGNAFVVWTINTGSLPRQLAAARFDVAASMWSSAASLSSGGLVLGWPSVAGDSFGNAFVAWTEQTSPSGGAAVVVAARYATASAAWVVSSPLSATAQTAFNAAVAADLAGNAVMVWHQTAGALAATLALRFSATPPTPAVTDVSPAPGTLHVAFSLPIPPDPSLAATTLEYSLDDGATWIARSPASVVSPLAISGLTDGATYALRMRAVNFSGAGLQTPAVPVRPGTGRIPTAVRVVSRAGNAMTFAWVAPPAGIVPDGYLIEGRISGHAQVLASLPTGGTATQLTLGVPNGTFDVWVVATYGGRRLGQSAPLPIAVNTAAFPSAPVNLLASAAGDTLALSWTNTWSGATLTGLQLLVGGTVTASVTLPVTESFAYAGVPPGTYTFAVTALNGTAPGGATSSVQVTFPGTCTGPPAPPAAFSLTTQGGRVFLDWLPPPSGAAVTSYVLAVSGAFNGALPTSTRSLAVPVGPGSYTVRVASVGPCGTSAFTSPQTVVVP